MTVGLKASVANGILDTTYATVFVKLHTADPGAAGATAASGTTTRVSATFNAAAAGSKALSNTPTWATWAGGSETLSHYSLWDNATAGNFLSSGSFTTPRAMVNGDTFTINTLTLTLGAVAA